MDGGGGGDGSKVEVGRMRMRDNNHAEGGGWEVEGSRIGTASMKRKGERVGGKETLVIIISKHMHVSKHTAFLCVITMLQWP